MWVSCKGIKNLAPLLCLFLSSCHLKGCNFHFSIIIGLTISDSHAGGANESNDGFAGRTLRPLHWTSEPTIPTIFPSTFIPLYDFGCTISVMFDVAVKRKLDAFIKAYFQLPQPLQQTFNQGLTRGGAVGALSKIHSS